MDIDIQKLFLIHAKEHRLAISSLKAMQRWRPKTARSLLIFRKDALTSIESAVFN